MNLLRKSEASYELQIWPENMFGCDRQLLLRCLLMSRSRGIYTKSCCAVHCVFLQSPARLYGGLLLRAVDLVGSVERANQTVKTFIKDENLTKTPGHLSRCLRATARMNAKPQAHTFKLWPSYSIDFGFAGCADAAEKSQYLRQQIV